MILCHAGPAVTPQTHTTSYARTPHSTYLAFVLHCVSFIPSLVPGPFKQLDTAALMVGLAALPGCRAAQHDKRPHHGSGESIVLPQYNAGRGTFFETHRRAHISQHRARCSRHFLSPAVVFFCLFCFVSPPRRELSLYGFESVGLSTGCAGDQECVPSRLSCRGVCFD